MTESIESARGAINSLLEEASDETLAHKILATFEGLESPDDKFQLARHILTSLSARLHRNEPIRAAVKDIALDNISGNTDECVDKIFSIYRLSKVGSDHSKKAMDVGFDFISGLPLDKSAHSARVFFRLIVRLNDADSEDMLKKVAPNVLRAFAFAADRAEKIENPELASSAARQLLKDSGWLSHCDINDRRQQIAKLNLLLLDEDRQALAPQKKEALHKPGLDII